MIEVHDLTKSFKDKKRGTIRAVDHVSFKCEAGQVYGLLGLNGAGKTTTLRLLATMLKPDEGGGTIAGHDLLTAPEAVRNHIGFHTGNTGLYMRLTGREILMYFGKLHGMNGSDLNRRIDEFASMLNMSEFLDTRVDKYSTGMKQKVNIARTLVHDPPVVILDEPTLGLDVLTSRAIVDFIGIAKRQGKAVILSTHIMHEAAKLCDIIGVIHGGKMIKQGTLDALKSSYSSDDLDDIFVSILEGGSA